jgi:hypothetical protein
MSILKYNGSLIVRMDQRKERRTKKYLTFIFSLIRIGSQ